MDPSNNNGGVLSASETNSASEESGIAQLANNNNNSNNNGGLISSASEESGITEVSNNNNSNNGGLPSASEESCLTTEAQKQGINKLLRRPPLGLELEIDESLWADLNWRVYPDQRQGRQYGDVVAKFFFGWKRMAWEIRETGLTNRIEIKWEQIVGMRVFLGDGNQLGILEVELNRPPLFFKETDPRPRRLIRGDQVPDFTDDQATNFREDYNPLTQLPSAGNENQFSANSDFEGAANESINGSASLTGIEEAMNAVSIHVMNGNNYGQVESTGSETP
ncbi:hypothetical protein PanWU01x14_238630 [Parasponia andersonii]|uniref:TRF2/HOY1 PH-like domain-containing protein n=1 Tax=Parasponia andersonii TaxID=3476 RepID=A0A2P5BHH4_PARAD|nr:hypothetical protein PanWU01x14_238630 [Parasponia andersonii]